ncbi:uncharacterized protein [Malus domestica]|uniref:uncharacterized protein n=1 Tax=Malus domestica TaxID=3750 RepID=UPI003975E272
MPSRRDPRQPAESSFPDIAQLGEAIVSAIQTAFRTPQSTPLETVHNLKLTRFMGNEGHERAEKWLNHVEKTFQESYEMTHKRLWTGEYLRSGYLKKQEFTHLRQGNMSANEYYMMFNDLSRYNPEVVANPEFYEILLRIEASENMPSESEEEERKNKGQRRNDKGKGQAFQGPCKTQNFKRSGGRSSSSSGGLSTNMQMRGGRLTGGPRFQRQRDFGGSGGSGAPLCRKCNNRHFEECRRGNNGCFTCGQMGHRAAQCPQIPGRISALSASLSRGSQWYQGGQPQQEEIAASNAGSSRQSSQQSHFAKVLIDYGATHSVISHTFAQVTQPHPTPLGYNLEFSMPRGDSCFVDRVYPGCPVIVYGIIMPANLMLLDIMDFDVIWGIDWLHYNRDKIDCYGKTVTFHCPGLPEITFVGEPSGVRHSIISAMKARRLLSKRCQGYLAHVVLNDDTPSSVKDVRVVRYFLNVFPDDLSGLSPDRELEFVIDLLPGTNPISLTPYRITPAELRELKVQLQELVDKGFI